MAMDGLNWTKIGLKLYTEEYFKIFLVSLNWTKIGLKLCVQFSPGGVDVLFELD